MCGTAVQYLPAPHPFIESFHGILFIGVYYDFLLLNGWLLVFAVSPVMASCQQQDGQSRHCFWKNEFRNPSQGLPGYGYAFCDRNAFGISNA